MEVNNTNLLPELEARLVEHNSQYSYERSESDFEEDYYFKDNQMDFYFNLFKIPSRKQEKIKFSKYMNEEKFSSKLGWITKEGNFLPVQYQGHDSLIYKLNEKCNLNKDVRDVEKEWLRITTGGIFTLSTTLSRRQQITLKKFLLQEKDYYFKDRDTVVIGHFGFAKYDGKNITLKKM